MATIKTYPEVVSRNLFDSFGISRMEEIYDKREGKTDVPHRHNYYTVLLVKEGEGTHFVDFNEYKLTNYQVYFVGPGQVHQVVEHKKTFGYSIVFSADFLNHNNLSVDFLEEINLFYDYETCPPLELNELSFKKLSNYCEEMHEYYHSQIKMKGKAIVSLLELFLIVCSNRAQCNQTNSENSKMVSGASILKGFKRLIENNYKVWHHTSVYAEELAITPDHLNRTVKAMTGQTAKEHIQSRLTVAAKRLLYFSPLTIQEIAYELGFSELANFSAFFKKCTGLSPKQFKLEKANAV